MTESWKRNRGPILRLIELSLIDDDNRFPAGDRARAKASAISLGAT
jgi:hypothetical protein